MFGYKIEGVCMVNFGFSTLGISRSELIFRKIRKFKRPKKMKKSVPLLIKTNYKTSYVEAALFGH